MKISHSMLAAAGLLALSCVSALAQQITGVPGSPSATTTIDGKQLPPPDPKFGGVIKERASESTPPEGLDVLIAPSELGPLVASRLRHPGRAG